MDMYPQAEPVKKTHTTRNILLGVLGALILVVCLGSMGAALSGFNAATDPLAGTQADVQGDDAAPAKPSQFKVPKASEFSLTVKVLEKDCFGEAGCVVRYRIDKIKYTGDGLDPDATYELTYEIKGLEDSKIGTLTVTDGGKVNLPGSDHGQAPPNPKLTAKVTAVEGVR